MRDRILPAVGLYANKLGWTDVNPYEIVEVNKSLKTIKIRAMKATLVPEFKPEFIVGGFSAHCVNQRDQEYTYESDPEAEIRTARLHKDGYFYTPNRGSRFSVDAQPRKFYDYNF